MYNTNGPKWYVDAGIEHTFLFIMHATVQFESANKCSKLRNNKDWKTVMIFSEHTWHICSLVRSWYFIWKKKSTNEAFFRDLIGFIKLVSNGQFYSLRKDLHRLC